MLAVVEHEEQVTTREGRRDVGGQDLPARAQAERRGHRLADPLGAVDRGQVDDDHLRRGGLGCPRLGYDVQGETALPDAAGAGDRDGRVGSDQAEHLFTVVPAADHRPVGARDPRDRVGGRAGR